MRIDIINSRFWSVDRRNEPAGNIPPVPIEDDTGGVGFGLTIDRPITIAKRTVLVRGVSDTGPGLDNNVLRPAVSVRGDLIVMKGDRSTVFAFRRTNYLVCGGVTTFHP